MPGYKEEDEEVKEAYEDYVKWREEETKSSPRNILTSVPRPVILGAFAVILFMMYLTFVRKTMQQSTFFWFIIALLVLILVLSVQSPAERKLIPESQLKAILYVKLKEKQRISPSEVPNGEVDVQLPCKLKKLEGRPVKYVLSFKVTTPSGLEKIYTAEMNPYDGYLMGFEERPAGFKGTEITDVSFIRRREDIWEQKYFKNLRKGGSGGAV